MADSTCVKSSPGLYSIGKFINHQEMSGKQLDEGCGDCEPLNGKSARDVESAELAEPFLDDSTLDSDSGRGTDSVVDPWDLPDFKDDSKKWSELTHCEKWKRVLLEWFGRAVALVALLYLFICSLDFLSSAFRLLGGKAAGAAFSNSALLQNPIAGLMIGVLSTVLVQSSSTSTSIVVTMVASGIIGVKPAIPIIMGANIGTSVTNTIVSISQSNDRDQFRRAFAGATVHDMFNWLSVIVLLPIEVATGYLFYVTSKLVNYLPQQSADTQTGFLKKLTKPFTALIVQLDKKIVEQIAIGADVGEDVSLIKFWCKYETQEVSENITTVTNTSDGVGYRLMNETLPALVNKSQPVDECNFLFHDTGMSDTIVGILLLSISLAMLCGCLILMVKNLKSLLRGKMASIVKNTLNADLPGKLAYFTGYLVIIVGAVMTMLVQSSSVFTSAMTPLVGVGLLRMERMYPLTLGANIGTTTTGLLAAMAASSDKLQLAMQIALCHLFFNLSGIAIFYVVPCMRWPVSLAKVMGNTTAEYRWFAILYLILMFFVLPGFVFGLSMAGPLPFAIVGGTVFVTLFLVILINVAQRKLPKILPKKLKTWESFPLWMRSLEPYDRIVMSGFKRFKCCRCCLKNEDKELKTVVVDVSILAVDTSFTDLTPNTTVTELTPSEKSLLMKETKEVVEVIVRDDMKTPLNDEEKLERIRTGLESGYVTAAPTPSITVQNTPSATPYGPTPSVSRVPSCSRILVYKGEEASDESNTRQVSSADSDDTKTDDSEQSVKDNNADDSDTEESRSS